MKNNKRSGYGEENTYVPFLKLLISYIASLGLISLLKGS